MVRAGLIALAALTAAPLAFPHGRESGWPHPHDGQAAARPVRLERYDGLGGDFALTGHHGRAVRLSDLRGKVVLVFFGYTHCPDACPQTVARVARAMRLLGDQRRQVRFLFITTDPERDTPKRLEEWLGAFDPGFVGLRGSSAELAAVEKRYGVFHNRLPPNAAEQSYRVNHTSRLFLIDRRGEVRYLFAPDQPAEAFAQGVRQALRPPSWWARVRGLLDG